MRTRLKKSKKGLVNVKKTIKVKTAAILLYKRKKI